jgi:hypothetical protein
MGMGMGIAESTWGLPMKFTMHILAAPDMCQMHWAISTWPYGTLQSYAYAYI